MSAQGLKRGSVAIVGAAEADLGQVVPETTPVDLMAQATLRALDDAGLKLSDVDGVFAAASQLSMASVDVCEYLGLQPKYQDSTRIGGSAFMSLLSHAHLALQSGLCSVAMITYGSTQRIMTRAAASPREWNQYETPYRMRSPVGAYALAASRHMAQYGTTRDQIAEVAVSARKWALLNPRAWEKDLLTIEDVKNARPVSTPFTVRDCCLVNDGGGAIIVTTAERARSLKKPPVYVLGSGECMSHRNITSMADLTVTGAAVSGPQAFKAAGLKPSEVNVLGLYDAFTINPILFLEDLGFCPKGEGGRFVEGGRIAPGGELAVNTSGGGLSYCHPGMYGLMILIEAVRQVRGEAGKRQVKDCNVALAHGNGGVLSTQCTAILGSAATV